MWFKNTLTIINIICWVHYMNASWVRFWISTDSWSHVRESGVCWTGLSSLLFILLLLFFVAISLSFDPHMLLSLSLSVQIGAKAPECCRRQAWDPIHCQSSTVYWADIVRRFIRFPLSEMTELCEAQLLWLKTQKVKPVNKEFWFYSCNNNRTFWFSDCALTLTLAVVVRGTWPVALPYSRFSCVAWAPTRAEKAVARWRRSKVFCGGIFNSRAKVSELKRGSRIYGRAYWKQM